MQKEINLEEILFVSKFKDLLESEKQTIKDGIIVYSFDEILSAMREACRQTLELALENVRANVVIDNFDGTYDAIINKQSILDTIGQIK